MRVTKLARAAGHFPRSVAIGSFDGVHLGHQDVLSGCDSVLTFDPHPLAALRPNAAPALLTDRRNQLRRLAELGIREVIIAPFDQAFATMSARAFVDEVLIGKPAAVRVSVGANFRFGAGAAGDVETLLADRRFSTHGNTNSRRVGRSSAAGARLGHATR